MAIYTATATAPAAYTANPDFTIPFEPRKLTFYVTGGGTHIVYISFDGATDHIRLQHTVAENYECTQHATRIWLKIGADAPVVTVIAEA